MDRTRRSFTETPGLRQPVASDANKVNALAIRIHGLRSVPFINNARLNAFFACADELQQMPERFIPLLVGEMKAACATLPELQPHIESRVLARVTLPTP